MIRIQQLKLPVGHSREALYQKAARTLRIKREQILSLTIQKQSIDARKKPDIFYSYIVDVSLGREAEKKCLFRCRDNRNITKAQDCVYRFAGGGTKRLAHPPVIIGTGPAGLFCGYMLAAAGYRPILLERGRDVEERQEDVRRFWETGELNPESNVSFGEGGAGAFSDGKLNTMIRDKDGRGRFVLETLVRHGAQREILYEGKPHVGTDVLTKVVKSMRCRIQKEGGQVRFQTRADGLVTQNGRVMGVRLSDGSVLDASVVVLAVGHSARDTFFWLSSLQVSMQAKAFAVGLRVEHPQALINRAMYADPAPKELPPSPYKLTARTSGGRGVYSFCMCPGGYVVNASSEAGCLAVNGMSYRKRDGKNANSAVVVSVTPEDFASKDPLSGIAFQRELEKRAYSCANGSVPVQRYGDFSQNATQGEIPDSFSPCIKGKWEFADLRPVLPKAVWEAFEEAMTQFGRTIPGFDDKNALLSGVESRTSSPVRICRDETFQSSLLGLYPCGEGAGYAGGITSAAMDGIRVAEAIASVYAPFSCHSKTGPGPKEE